MSFSGKQMDGFGLQSQSIYFQLLSLLSSSFFIKLFGKEYIFLMKMKRKRKKIFLENYGTIMIVINNSRMT